MSELEEHIGKQWQRRTPGRWEVRTRNDGSRSITGAYHHEPGQHPWTGGILLVCEMSGDRHHDEANAAFIIRAANNFDDLHALAESVAAHCAGTDDLVKALGEIEKSIGDLGGLINKAQYNADELGQGIAAWEPVADTMHDGTMAMIQEEIRAALAKAAAPIAEQARKVLEKCR